MNPPSTPSSDQECQSPKTHLKERVLLLLLKLVGTENLITTFSLFIGETFLGTLEELEDIINDDCLEVNLFLVIKVLSTELDLAHVDISICMYAITSASEGV